MRISHEKCRFRVAQTGQLLLLMQYRFFLQSKDYSITSCNLHPDHPDIFAFDSLDPPPVSYPVQKYRTRINASLALQIFLLRQARMTNSISDATEICVAIYTSTILLQCIFPNARHFRLPAWRGRKLVEFAVYQMQKCRGLEDCPACHAYSA